MSLSEKRKAILDEFQSMRRLQGYATIWKHHPMGVARDVDKWIEQQLQSYGAIVEQETREEVIEEIQKHVHEQAIESQTDVNIEFDLYLDQLRSTQPKEEGNIQQLPDTFVKGRHTGSTIAVKTFSIKLTDKDKR